MNLRKKIAARLFCLLISCAGMVCSVLGLCGPTLLWGAVHERRPLVANAASQNNDEAKAAHAHYEKAMKKKDARARFQLLQEGATRFPFSAELHYALGREYHQRAQLDSALAHFERVKDLDATLARKTELHAFLPQAYSALAQQALKLGKLAQAESAAQNALRHDENHLPALSVAAVAAYQLKRYEQAIAHGARLLKLQPSAQNHNNLAAVYEARGEPVLAEQHYQQAVVLDPNLGEAQKNLQRVRARLAELVTETAREVSANKNSTKTQTSAPSKPELKSKSATPANTTAPAKPAPTSTKSSSVKTQPAPAQREPAKRESSKSESKKPELKKSEPLKREASEFESTQSAPTKRDSSSSPKQSLPQQTAPLRATPLREDFNTVRTPEADGYSAAVWVLAFFALSVIIWRSTKLPSVRSAIHAFVALFDKKKNAPQQRPRPAHVMNDENTRMLRRLNDEKKLLPATAESMSAAQPHDVPLFAPERARLALPAPLSAPIKVEPEIGLQTEMFFAEMIAASPEIFESTNPVPELLEQKEEGYHSGVAMMNGRESRNGSVARHDERMSEVVAPALPDSGDTASSSNESAIMLTQTPRTPASPMVVTPSALVAAQEVQTPVPVVRAVLEQTPSYVEAHTDTRTMSLPALVVQRIGRYVIEKELAQGTTGKIYKAWDPKLDRIVVLKTVQYGLSTSPSEIAALKERIYREARAIAKLNHPNIVIVYDVDDQPEFSYLVMEYLEGRDLKQVLEQEHRLECGRALEIAAQVCNAMEYAHRAGVFHRDLKPSNIMLLEKDEVKVMDFGIAKISNYLSLTQTGRVLGTPSYMAPEQIEGHATDGRADLFSLGVVLYELLVGKRPFVADSLAALAYKIVHKMHMPPSLVNVELPLALDEALNRALAKKPEERHQNATELCAALLAVKAQLVESQSSV